VRRREFIAGLGGAVTSPLAARAQQTAMPVIGFLSVRSRDQSANLMAGFHQGLKEVGYVEGQNLAIEYRWAEGQYDRLPSLARDLVGRRVAVIVAAGGDTSALAAKAVTSTIPIVFTSGGDPIASGLVASFNRPGGNATGVAILTSQVVTKRLELLVNLVPTAKVVGALVNPNSPNAISDQRDADSAARVLKRQLFAVNARTERDFEAAFATLAQQRIGALLVFPDAVFVERRDELVALATRYAIPAIYYFREFADAGGLLSYGLHFADAFRQVGVYTGRILKGEKAADLPVVQPTKLEFVINLKVAKALGLSIPETLLATADEVIE
jgi:putative tryptophan/tyrosine transport system substrate-binding protein